METVLKLILVASIVLLIGLTVYLMLKRGDCNKASDETDRFQLGDLRAQIEIPVSNSNIFFVWVGKRPDKKYLDQIKTSIASTKYYNSESSIYLFTNLLTSEEVSCTVVPMHYRSFYRNSPVESLKIAPEGECPTGWKNIKPAIWSDIFRFIVLWKYGGSYIDLDDISIRSLPTDNNMYPACAIQDKRESQHYGGGISGKFAKGRPSYQWRFGADPMINMSPRNPFIERLLTECRSYSCNPEEWGQLLPTKIFQENPQHWRKYVTPTPWHDMLYHPKHDGHSDFDKRYPGKKIKCYDRTTPQNLSLLLDNYAFFIVRNHNFDNTNTDSVLAALMKTGIQHYWRPALIRNIFDTNMIVQSELIFDIQVPLDIDEAYGAPDPFLVNGWMFSELIQKKGKKGCIAVARLGKELDYKIIIREDFHMSFPYVFQHRDTWYMIPETYEAGKIILYRATSFPYEWERLKTLYEMDGIDSIPFTINGKWYLFTTSEKSQETMVLTTTDFPEGKWTVAKKKVLPRAFRGGGTALYNGDKVILPIQPSSQGGEKYGSRLELYSVEPDLSMKKFDSLSTPNGAKGMHHLSYDPYTRMMVVDLREKETEIT